MNNILDSINRKALAKRASLNKVPVLTEGHGDYIMAALETATISGGWFARRITHTESKYTIEVNIEALKRMQKCYMFIFGSRKAAIDLTYGLLLHEFRHCYQSQIQFKVGQEYSTFNCNELFDGHGSTPEEQDANDFMIANAKNPQQKALFEYFKLEQSCDGFENQFSREFNTQLREKGLETIKLYNPVWYWCVRLFTSSVNHLTSFGRSKIDG